MSRSLKQNFFFSSILTTANYIFPLLTYPYVSRVLGVNNIGICNFVDSIVSSYLIFSMMGITSLGIREIAKNKNSPQQLTISFNNLFILNTITTIITLVIYISFCIFSKKMHEYTDMMILGSFKIIFSYILIEWFYRGLEEFKYITVRTLIVKCLYVISVFVFVKDNNDYKIYYFLSVLMIVVNAIINIKRCNKYISFTLKNINFKSYLKPFFILGLDSICGAMYTTFNTAYLGFITNDIQVGYYTTATKLYYICSALFSAFTGVMIPRLTVLLSEGKMKEYKHMLNNSNDILFSFLIPATIFLIIDAPEVIYLISEKGYEGAVTPMRIIMPLMVIIGYKQIIVLQGFLPLGKNNAILYNSVIGAFVSIISNICLVHLLYAKGSAIVWCLAEISGLILSQYLIYKYIHMKFPYKLFFINFIIYIPIGVFLILLKYEICNPILRLTVSLILLIIYFIVINVYVKRNNIIYNLLYTVKHKFFGL